MAFVGDAVSTFFLYIVGSLYLYFKTKHGVYLSLFITTTLYCIADIVFGDSSNNPSSMFSQYLTGLDKDHTFLALVPPFIAQVLGGLCGAVAEKVYKSSMLSLMVINSILCCIVDIVLRVYDVNAAFMVSQYLPAGLGANTLRSLLPVVLIGSTIVLCSSGPWLPPNRIAEVEMGINFIYFFIISLISGYGQFHIEWGFTFIVMVAFEVTGAGDMGITLNPSHKFGETLINSTITMEHFFLYWFCPFFGTITAILVRWILIKIMGMLMSFFCEHWYPETY